MATDIVLFSITIFNYFELTDGQWREMVQGFENFLTDFAASFGLTIKISCE